MVRYIGVSFEDSKLSNYCYVIQMYLNGKQNGTEIERNRKLNNIRKNYALDILVYSKI